MPFTPPGLDTMEPPVQGGFIPPGLHTIEQDTPVERNPEGGGVSLLGRVARSDVTGNLLHAVSRLRPDILIRDLLTGLGQPQRYLGYDGGIEAPSPMDQPMISPEAVKAGMDMLVPRGSEPTGFGEGVQNFVGNLVSGMSTLPNMAGLLGGKISLTIPAVTFIPPVVEGAPQAIQNTIQAKTPQDRVSSGLNTLVSVLGPIGMARGLVPEVKSSGIGYSDINPSLRVEDYPQAQEVAPANRQLALGRPTIPQGLPSERPYGAARFAPSVVGASPDISQLSPREQVELARVPQQFVPREEYVRPSQGPTPIIGGEPFVPRPIKFIPPDVSLIEPVVPNKPPVEPSGGEISFRSEASAEGIPNALQQAKESNASTIRNDEIPVSEGYTRVYRGEGEKNVKLPEWALTNAGEWFTTRKQKAVDFQTARGGQLRQLDIPTNELEQFKAPSGNDPNEYLINKVAQENYAKAIRSDQTEPSQQGHGQEVSGETRGNDFQQFREGTQQAESGAIREEGKTPEVAPVVPEGVKPIEQGGSIPSEAKGMQTKLKPGQGTEGGSIINPFSAPGVQKIVDNTVKFGSDLKKFVKSGANKERISQLLDAADNQAKISANQIGNRIRVALPSEVARKALTFVVEANGDRTKLREFLNQTTSNPDAQKTIRYAIANLRSLTSHAAEASRLMEQQRQLEIANKVNTDEAPNYIKHAYESRNEDFFDPGATGSGVSTSFKKQRTFATYAEAIEAGYKPKNLDAADLVESRIAAGGKMVNRIKWGEALHVLRDPSDSKPLTEAMVTQPKGTQVAPSGYQPREILPGMRVAVKDGYTGIFDALTGKSDVSNSWLGRTALQTEGVIKHGLLLFDSFHASRVMQKQVFLTGQVGYKKGLSLLEYDEPTLGRMVRNGEIDQKTANWAKENRPNAQLLLKNGLNVGRLAESLYSDVVRKELKVLGKDVNLPGRFNKWVFDKMTRGAMMQSALIELERAQNNHPEWTPDEAASYASKQINVYFGNLGRQGLFKSVTKQDALRLAFLAPQWVESMVQTEARAYKQAVEVPYDAAFNNTLRIGTAAKGVGIGLISYVIATQILNKYTTGKFTWEGDDKEHKLDAYIPDPTGKSGGFWISPFSVAAEVTHDAIRYGAQGKSALEVAGQIVGNKFSPLLRAEEILRTGRDYAGNKILGTEERLKQAGKALIPVPLPLSSVKSDQPGQGQRQVYGSLGLKVEIAKKQKGEQDKIANEKFGKDFKDLTVGQRLQVEKAKVKESQSIQQRFNIAQKATENEYVRLQTVQDGLSPKVKEWLEKTGGKLTEFPQTKEIGGKQLRLTEDEQKRLTELMAVEYEKSLSKLVDRPGVNEKNVNRYISVNLELARKRAWSEMRKEISTNARGMNK